MSDPHMDAAIQETARAAGHAVSYCIRSTKASAERLRRRVWEAAHRRQLRRYVVRCMDAELVICSHMVVSAWARALVAQEMVLRSGWIRDTTNKEIDELNRKSYFRTAERPEEIFPRGHVE